MAVMPASVGVPKRCSLDGFNPYRFTGNEASEQTVQYCLTCLDVVIAHCRLMTMIRLTLF